MARKKTPRLEELIRHAPSIEAWPLVSRREWLALAAIILIGASLRVAYPGRMAIEHFDEGVYSTNIYFGDAEDGQYPYRHLYAPPLLPFLIEMGIIAFGPDSLAPFLPALIFGTATVPLAWWAVRNWFGPLAGLLAAALIATSDFHILYSRTALTDVPVAFLVLLAVSLYWEAIRRESVRWSVAAGIATGLAWWTKYTGWLPVAIAAAGSVGWLIVEGRTLRRNLQTQIKIVGKCFTTMAIAAFVVWSPVLLGLQHFGGYSSVAENHRGYLRLLSWASNAREQVGNVAAQSGALTAIGVTLLFAVVSFRSKWGLIPRILLACFSGTIIFRIVFDIGPLLPLSLLCVAAFVFEYFATLYATTNVSDESDPDVPRAVSDLKLQGLEKTRHRRLAIFLLAAWFAGMVVTVPLYQDFPRLALPWLMAALLGISVWGSRPLKESITKWPVTRAEVIAAAMLLLLALTEVTNQTLPIYERWFTTGWSVPAWQDRTSLQSAASQIAEVIEQSRSDEASATIVYVFAEPAAFYHLASTMASEQIGVMPAGNLAFVQEPPPGVEVFVVYGWKGELSLLGTDNRKWFSERTTPVVQVDYAPSTLVRLDGESTHLLKEPPTTPYRLSLFRIGKAVWR